MAVEIIVQQGIVKLFAIEDVETESGFIENQQFGVDGHHDGEVQLRNHAFGQFTDLVAVADGGPSEKAFGLGAIESRMYAGEIIERLGNSDPSREHGDIGNEADIAHELIAFGPWIAAEDF